MASPPHSGPPPPPSTSPPPPSTSPPPPPPPPPPPSTSPPPPSKSSSPPRSPPPPPPPSPPRHSQPPPPNHPSPGHRRPPPPERGSNAPSTKTKSIIIGASAGGGLLLLVMIACVVSFARRKKRPRDSMTYYRDASNVGKEHVVNISNAPDTFSRATTRRYGSGRSSNFSEPYNPPLPPPHPGSALGFNKSTFGYEELAAATGGFSTTNLLGHGGLGLVHKGVLPTGKEIAVRSLKSGWQGEGEFEADVEDISRVHHRHLVSLVGYCISGSRRLLVYEFMANESLEHHLHGNGRAVMDWNTRMRIALGSAKGLAYLHEDCHALIIHGDMKASNILLDHNFEPKVAGFGLAKLSTGTSGYMAPEYEASGKLTEKCDVFSFGIILLELITGKPPIGDSEQDIERYLIDWARPHLSKAMEDGEYKQLVDLRLEKTYNSQEMTRMITCAASSVRQSARRRPKMSQIVRALEEEDSLDDLKEGVMPGYDSMGEGSDFYTNANKPA